MMQLLGNIARSLVLLLFFFLIRPESNQVSVSGFIHPDNDTIIELLYCMRPKPPIDTNSVRAVIGTYLGNQERNFYGNELPSNLNVVWKIALGYGKSAGVGNQAGKLWVGAGWTGQPLLVREDSVNYIIQGSFDHHLKKINAQTGELIWQYKFDDILKGTGTFWVNDSAKSYEEKYVILQGSRRGEKALISSEHVPSFRAISFITGKELWRMDIKRTDSYSRDVDASALLIGDTAYIGLENGIFSVFNPDNGKATIVNNMSQPTIYNEMMLYEQGDKVTHGANLVTESSPSRLGHRVYVTSGSGHIYGYNLKTRVIDWDLKVNADLDGTPVVTKDSCLLITLEKEYIKGRGGVMKIDPSLPPDSSIVWFFPTKNKSFALWAGGIVGSVAINDYYVSDSQQCIAVFIGIDGFLYVVDHQEREEKKVIGPNQEHHYFSPVLIYSKNIGPSISTPIVVKNRIVAASYSGVYLLEFDDKMNFKLLKYVPGIFEATPMAYDSRVYLASRDGNLYCFGDSDQEEKATEEDVLSVEKQVSDKLKLADLKGRVSKAIQSISKRQISKQMSSESDIEPDPSKYYMVRGTFRDRERADLFSAMLVEQGQANNILGPVNGNFYIITDIYVSYNESFNALVNLKEAGISQVWVLKL